MNTYNEFYKVIKEYYSCGLRTILAPTKIVMETKTSKWRKYVSSELPSARYWSYAAQVNFRKLIRGM